MRIPTALGRKLTAALSTVALTVTGLSIGVVAAPSAAADTSPIAAIDSTRVTADGLPTVQIDGVAWDQVINGNTVYVGGQFANARPAGAAAGTNLTPRSNLLAYNLTTGALITTFAPSLNSQVKGMALSPNGSRLYVVGQFTKADAGANRYRVAAYDTATGALVSNFAPVINTTVNAVVATNTTVYIGGNFSSSGNSFRTRLAAYNASTGALLNWAPTADATVNAMTLASDGTIIIGGSFQNVNGSPAYGLAKLDPVSGALIPWTATTDLIRNAGANSAILSLTSDGDQVYGSGYHYGEGGNLEGIFSSNASTGEIKWVEDCHGDTYDVWAGSANTVYSVSHAHYCGNLGGFPQSEPNWGVNMKRSLAFTKNATGTLGHDPHGYYDYYGTPSPSLVNWFPLLAAGTYTGKSQAAWSITGNSQYVVLGGEFPSVNGIAQQGLVRFAIPSVAPKKQGPVYTGSLFNPTLVGLPSGSVRVAWQANTDRDDLKLDYTLTRNGQTVFTTADSSPFWARANMGYIDSAVTPGQSYTYRITATDAAGNIARSDNVSITAPVGGSSNVYAQKVIADGAAPYWPMNETSGTVLLDNSGFNDADAGTGITRGTAGAIPGNAATTFDGATTASTRTAIAGPNTFTSQVWIKTNTTSGGKILGFGGSQTGASGSYDRHIYMDNDGRIWFGVYPNAVATVNSSATYNDNNWHQITASLGPDGMKLYVDAKLVGQRGDVTWGQDFQGYWRVGGDNLDGWPNGPASRTFAGAIDEVAIYATVLTRQTIDAQWVASGRTSTIPAAPADAYGNAIFNDNPLLFWRLGETSGTTAADSGPNGDQTGAYQNGVSLGADGGIKGTDNKAATFDGNDDFVSSSSTFTNPKNYSEEAWFKTTSAQGKIIGFGSRNSGTSDGYDRHVYLNGDGTLVFGTWTGFMNTITTPKAYNDGVWHQVVATQSTTDGMKLYVDGQLVGTNGQTDAQDYTGYWRVGGDNNWGSAPYFNGTIDDAAVYNYVLNPTQVANHFNLGNTVVAPNQVPVASFTSNSVYLDAAFTSTASDPDGTIAGYEWNFGDSSAVSTETNPTHTYAAAGTYTVTLKVTDNNGASTVVTNPVTVTAPPANVPPTATFAISSQNQLTIGVDANGSADSDGTITGYAWNFGDGGTANGVTASHTYTAAGPYTVTLEVTDDKGAKTTTTQTVNVTAPVNQAPVASFTVTPAQLSVTVDGSGSSDPDGTISSYSWTFGDGPATASGVKPPAHTYAAAGTYTITLTVTDNKGAQHSSAQPVTVSAPPANVAPSAGFQQTNIDGLTANLESTSTDSDGQIVKWEWNFGDNATDSTTGAAVVHTYAAGGTYSVTLKVTDNSGATATSSQNVTVTAPVTPNNAPVASFTNTTSNLTVNVDGSGSTDGDGTVSSYSWKFGDGSTDQVTTPTATHTYLAAGTYSVTLTVTDDDGATNEKTVQVTVTIPAPVALVSDTFSRTVANAFGTAETGSAWTIAGGNTNFSVNSGTGKIRIPTAGATLTASQGQVSAADLDMTFQMTLDKAATGGGVYVSAAVRKVGNSEYRVSPRFTNAGGIQVQLIKVVAGTSTVLTTTNLNAFAYSPGELVSVRFKVTGSSTVTLQSKVWKSAAGEPAAWQTTATDSSAPLTTAGTLQFIAYLSGSATNAPVVVSVDSLTVYATTP